MDRHPSSAPAFVLYVRLEALGQVWRGSFIRWIADRASSASAATGTGTGACAYPPCPDGSHRPNGNCRSGRTTSAQVLPQALKQRMPHLALGGFSPILDLGEQLGLDPDALMRDALGIGLG